MCKYYIWINQSLMMMMMSHNEERKEEKDIIKYEFICIESIRKNFVKSNHII